MSTAAMIDDYLVASFPLPSASASSSAPSTPHTAALDVTAVQYTKHARQDSRLAVATPGVGISVYDVSPPLLPSNLEDSLGRLSTQ